MTIPTIDTFEHDIAEEIKTKEATLTDIASAGGEVANIEVPPQPARLGLWITLLIILLAISGLLVWYFFVRSAPTAQPTQTTSSTQQGEPSSRFSVRNISTYLDDALGGNIERVQSSPYGYTLTLHAYTPVFAYMIKNESVYADELAAALHSEREVGTSSVPFTFSDLTVSNQTMRVGTSGSSTVIYAFVNAQTLIMSSSTEGILTLRNAILSQ